MSNPLTSSNGKHRLTLVPDVEVDQRLRRLVANGEAVNIPDAIRRVVTIGLQVTEMFDDGYTEVIFQNPNKRRAIEVDLYRNLK